MGGGGQILAKFCGRPLWMAPKLMSISPIVHHLNFPSYAQKNPLLCDQWCGYVKDRKITKLILNNVSN